MATLDGRKIETGLLEGSIVFYVSERILERAEIDPTRFALVPIVQVPVRMEMLLAGKVEAACLAEPLATPGVLLFTRKVLAEKQNEIAALPRYQDIVSGAFAGIHARSP